MTSWNRQKWRKNRLFSESKKLLLIFKVKPEKSKKGSKKSWFSTTPFFWQKIDPRPHFHGGFEHFGVLKNTKVTFWDPQMLKTPIIRVLGPQFFVKKGGSDFGPTFMGVLSTFRQMTHFHGGFEHFGGPQKCSKWPRQLSTSSRHPTTLVIFVFIGLRAIFRHFGTPPANSQTPSDLKIRLWAL